MLPAYHLLNQTLSTRKNINQQSLLVIAVAVAKKKFSIAIPIAIPTPIFACLGPEILRVSNAGDSLFSNDEGPHISANNLKRACYVTISRLRKLNYHETVYFHSINR